MSSEAVMSINYAYNGDNEIDNTVAESEFANGYTNLSSTSELSSERVQRVRNVEEQNAIRKTEETLKRVAEVTLQKPKNEYEEQEEEVIQEGEKLPLQTDKSQPSKQGVLHATSNKPTSMNNTTTASGTQRAMISPPALHPAKLKTVATANTVSQYLIRLTKSDKQGKVNSRNHSKLSISARGKLLAQDRLLGRKRPTFEEGVDVSDLPQDIPLEELKARIHRELEEYRKMGPLMPHRGNNIISPSSRATQHKRNAQSKRPIMSINQEANNSVDNNKQYRETGAFGSDTVNPKVGNTNKTINNNNNNNNVNSSSQPQRPLRRSLNRLLTIPPNSNMRKYISKLQSEHKAQQQQQQLSNKGQPQRRNPMLSSSSSFTSASALQQKQRGSAMQSSNRSSSSAAIPVETWAQRLQQGNITNKQDETTNTMSGQLERAQRQNVNSATSLTPSSQLLQANKFTRSAHSAGSNGGFAINNTTTNSNVMGNNDDDDKSNSKNETSNRKRSHISVFERLSSLGSNNRKNNNMNRGNVPSTRMANKPAIPFREDAEVNTIDNEAMNTNNQGQRMERVLPGKSNNTRQGQRTNLTKGGIPNVVRSHNTAHVK